MTDLFENFQARLNQFDDYVTCLTRDLALRRFRVNLFVVIIV